MHKKVKFIPEDRKNTVRSTQVRSHFNAAITVLEKEYCWEDTSRISQITVEDRKCVINWLPILVIRSFGEQRIQQTIY